ncbi:hypothetical protein [Puerhibacterium puerhi]|uniref:hypothetical protein n=1 Tax=Puerhibacterium puerhi TaxID=2692623 RepID=UPI0013592C78|nr:hypothetical protein [Puerhibacterium puerhi]
MFPELERIVFDQRTREAEQVLAYRLAVLQRRGDVTPPRRTPGRPTAVWARALARIAAARPAVAQPCCVPA